MRPESILDHTGMLSTVISKAPVETSWVSMALLMKKIIMDAYRLFSNAQAKAPGASTPKPATAAHDATMQAINSNLA